MAKDVVIGLDIGTTTVKAVATRECGAVVSSYTKRVTSTTGVDGRAVQDPKQLVQAVVDVLKGLSHYCDPQSVKGLALSSAMHSLVLLGKDFQPVTPIMTWSDSRAKAVAQDLRRSSLGPQFYQRTGVPIHAMSPMVKLMWLKDKAGSVFQTFRYIADIKSYVMQQLTGQFVVDSSCAGATGLRNLRTGEWDPVILAELGLAETHLPQIVPPQQLFSMTHPALDEWQHVPLMVGGSDGCLATFASDTGQVETTLTMGTSAAVRQLASTIALDSKGRTFCYELAPQRYVIGAASNNGGNILEWTKELLNRDFTELSQLMERGEIGAHGLRFTPYLLGERSVLMDETAQGDFSPIAFHHGPEDFVRAIGEGLMLNLSRLVTLTETIGQASEQLVVSGGAMNFQPFQRILADILNRPLVERIQEDSSAIGAAKFFYTYTEGVDRWQCVNPYELTLEANPLAHETYQRLGLVP